MNKFVSRLLATAAICAAATSLASPAEAQRVNRIVALGDSYIDDGNVFELTGQPVPPVFPLGRFSNGTNLVDTLGRILNAPILNYGIGGAVVLPQSTTIPQVQLFDVQVQSFLGGGGPAAFPRSDGSFAPDDLLIVNIGANDARAYQFSLGRAPNPPTQAQIATLVAGAPAQAQVAAGAAIRNLDRLVAAGARNITVLGGDVGGLPEVRGQPLAAVGSAYSNAFNARVREALAGYAINGAIVNYLDLTLLQRQVENNLAAFNLQGAGACPVPACLANSEVANRFLVYFDQLHLTERGYEIVGQYAARQLEAPLQLEAQGETVIHSASGFGRALSERLDLAGGGHGGEGLRVFIAADFSQKSHEDSDVSLGYQLERGGGTAGIEYQAGQFLVGLAGSLTQSNADFNSGTGQVDADSMHVGVYGNWSNGNAFAEIYGGIGRVDLEIQREAVIDTITADPEADTIVAGGQIGYLFDIGRLKVGPVLGIDYARAEIDGYTETGDPVLTLAVSDQEVDRLVGSAGVELRGAFDIGGSMVEPHLTVAAEQELEEVDRVVRYALTAAPNIVNNWVLGGSDDTYARVTGGASFTITEALRLQVSGSTTIGEEGGDESAASIALRFGF